MQAPWWIPANLRLQVHSKGGSPSVVLANSCPKGVRMWSYQSSKILREARNLDFYVQSPGFLFLFFLCWQINQNSLKHCLGQQCVGQSKYFCGLQLSLGLPGWDI